jgi:hypothetical protein
VAAPAYSDNEGFFERRGGGRVPARGSVLEWRNRQRLKQEVLGRFRQDLQEFAQHAPRYDAVYLFAPDYRARAYRRRLPVPWRRELKELFYGNFTDAEPLTLLERIAERERRDSPAEPISREAKKLLDKAAQARRVIRG